MEGKWLKTCLFYKTLVTKENTARYRDKNNVGEGKRPILVGLSRKGLSLRRCHLTKTNKKLGHKAYKFLGKRVSGRGLSMCKGPGV